MARPEPVKRQRQGADVDLDRAASRQAMPTARATDATPRLDAAAQAAATAAEAMPDAAVSNAAVVAQQSTPEPPDAPAGRSPARGTSRDVPLTRSAVARAGEPAPQPMPASEAPVAAAGSRHATPAALPGGAGPVAEGMAAALQRLAGPTREARTEDGTGDIAPNSMYERSAAPVQASGDTFRDEGREQRGPAQAPGQDAPARGNTSAPAVALVHAADGTLRLSSVPAPPALPGATPQAAAENVERLVQTMRVLVKDGTSEATVRLRPEHLGEVTVTIKVEGRVVVATVHAESAGVREWLQAHEDVLRGGLSQHGLQLDRLVVQRDGKHDRREHTREEPRRHRPRPDRGHEERFEVTV
jgi:flagellar hook-length control protein FliK